MKNSSETTLYKNFFTVLKKVYFIATKIKRSNGNRSVVERNGNKRFFRSIKVKLELQVKNLPTSFVADTRDARSSAAVRLGCRQLNRQQPDTGADVHWLLCSHFTHASSRHRRVPTAKRHRLLADGHAVRRSITETKECLLTW